MGGQNVLSGTVATVANGMARVVSASGEQYAVPLPQKTAVTDTGVFFSIRRDRIEVTKALLQVGNLPEDINTIRGMVHAIEYQGAYVKVAIRRTDHEDFVAYLTDSDFFTKRVDIGDWVVARWSVADVHLLEAAQSHKADRKAISQLYGGEPDTSVR
jgi:hypothetical protein